ncbi:hypothetical protein [Streptomyces tropicalis]|uniref:Integral membrane protein n=1 Tax=Streptomyces tropicalis TaxID=3034234 RepID=A0ABT6A175_9ACTN|nr:hypothetical protein [Streptomyces tropicalis]MDF3298397.1 hypothetical protein [Streptomyces tropicalis]
MGRRRAELPREGLPSVSTVLHNLAAFLIVFQTAVLYFAAGYGKITGKMWQDGVAMYYISRITGFETSTTYAHLMSNAFVGTAVCHVTIFIEVALPFAVLSARPWVRKVNTMALEGLHVGIMVCMGLVCFGLLMIGADGTCLRGEEYRSLARRFRAVKERLLRGGWSPSLTRSMASAAMAAGHRGVVDA